MVSVGADICKVLTLWKVLIDVSFISRLRSDNDSWAAEDNLVNREIVKDRMYYYLTADEATWNAYAEAAINTKEYNVNIVDLIASMKYSPFIL